MQHSNDTPTRPSRLEMARTRDQIMADTLVERLTGQTRAGDVNVELQLMMPLDALDQPE